MTEPDDSHSSTRPISVAELLAKNGTIGAPPVGGRRRRRRGNSDSVTVAELTGEIPIVRTDDVARPSARPSHPDDPGGASTRSRQRRRPNGVADHDDDAETEARRRATEAAEHESTTADDDYADAVADYAAHLERPRRRRRPGRLLRRRRAARAHADQRGFAPVGRRRRADEPGPGRRRRRRRRLARRPGRRRRDRRDEDDPTTSTTTDKRRAAVVPAVLAPARCSAARPSPTTWPGADASPGPEDIDLGRRGRRADEPPRRRRRAMSAFLSRRLGRRPVHPRGRVRRRPVHRVRPAVEVEQHRRAGAVGAGHPRPGGRGAGGAQDRGHRQHADRGGGWGAGHAADRWLCCSRARRDDADRHVRPAIKVGLSTASVYPLRTEAAFEYAARLGYDGVELMVWAETVSQDIDADRASCPSATACRCCRCTRRAC